MEDWIPSNKNLSIGLMTALAFVGLLAVTAGTSLASTHAGMLLTGAGAATPIPGDSAIGLTVFSYGMGMMPNGPGGFAAKFGVMA